jgi:hypothetical protein
VAYKTMDIRKFMIKGMADAMSIEDAKGLPDS